MSNPIDKQGKVHVTGPSTYEVRVGNLVREANLLPDPPEGWQKMPEDMVYHAVFKKWMPADEANKEYWVDPKEIGLSDKDLNMDEDEEE